MGHGDPVSGPGLAPRPIRRILYALGRGLFLFLGFLFWRIKVLGSRNIPQKGAVIIASNHISFFDPPFVGISVPRTVHFIAKQQLFEVPILGWLIRQVNAIPVRREEHDVSVFKTAQRLLESGEAIVMFPEGTRSRTGHIGKAKPGVGMLAAKTGACVVPAYVHNTDQINRFKKVEVHFAPPLQFEGHRDYQHFADAVLEEVRRMQKEVERVS